MLYKKITNFFIINIIFFISSSNCAPFITNVEYPNRDFKTTKRSKIAINLQGDIFILNKGSDKNEWVEDFGKFNALNFWKRILGNTKPEILIDVLFRNSQLEFLRNEQTDPFDVMLRIVQNLCFFTEMLAWKKVFFDSQWLFPTFFDDAAKGGNQKICILLETARCYAYMADFLHISNLERRASRLRTKAHLSVWGPIFMIKQAAGFYSKYIMQVMAHLNKVASHKDYQLMLKQVSLNSMDAQYMHNILAEAPESGVEQINIELITSALEQIETALGIRQRNTKKSKFTKKSALTKSFSKKISPRTHSWLKKFAHFIYKIKGS